MKTTLEQEIKLRPGTRFRGIDLKGREIAPRSLWSTYYDTDDLRLAAGRLTLRRRGSGAEAVWQLKLGHGQDRTELEWPAPTTDVPDEVANLVLAHTRARLLSPIATLHTERRGVVVQKDGTDIAEVTDDHVDVVDENRVVASFDELEVELVGGDVKALRKLERKLRKRGAVDPDGRPKLFQAIGFEPNHQRGNPRSARECLKADLQEQYQAILEYDPGTRLGTDTEQLHKQRVAVRRIRATLRAGRPLLDRAWADNLRGALRRLGQDLGKVRDLDVQIERFEELGGGEMAEQLRTRRAEAQAELVRELSSAWYISLLNRLEQAVEHPAFSGRGSLRAQVRKEHRRARRKVKHLPSHPSDTQLHDVRKAVKRARYSAEVAASCSHKGLDDYIDRAKDVQDLLGEHQDAVVSIELVHQLGGPADLVEQNEARKRAVRKAFPKRWKKLDRAR